MESPLPSTERARLEGSSTMTFSTTADLPVSGLQFRSLLTDSGELELTLEPQPITPPAAGEVVVRVEASPVNPSDLGLLLGAADLSTARIEGDGSTRRTSITVPAKGFQAMKSRVGTSMPVGNEGAGVVVAAGDDAKSLLGKTVAVLGGGMYTQYRTLPSGNCLVLPNDVTAAEGASCFVNPLTALGMVETMRAEGHTALVHTAAASNLGQMLNRVCLADGVPLVNIVRRDEQAAILRDFGAEHIVDSSSLTFTDDLTAALIATGATLAFDAIGGGPLAGQILSAMEAAVNAKGGEYSRYGSDVHKQLYIYG